MFKCSFPKILTTVLILIYAFHVRAEVTPTDDSKKEANKNYIEDIFIWKISDELKLSVQEEKAFTEIQKSLNKKKSELNKRIQDSLAALKDNASEADLKKHRQLLQEYNALVLQEFDSIKKALGAAKFTQYLKIKNELTNKMKSILAGESASKQNASNKALLAPKVIIEK